MSKRITFPSSSGNECPKCHGTGWILSTGVVDGYDDQQGIIFAQKCTECSGFRRQTDQTGVPGQFYSADISKFDFNIYSKDMGKFRMLCENFVFHFPEWEKAGKGMYLWSTTPGSGKTFLSCCLAKSLMIKYDLCMRFITAPDYISVVGDSYKREFWQEDPSEIYRTCKVLVLDDIGAQADKEWQRQELFRLINTRMENGIITIYTSNVTVEKLNVDERTKDRIIKHSIVLNVPEESIRRKLAAAEQDHFLQKVLNA